MFGNFNGIDWRKSLGGLDDITTNGLSYMDMFLFFSLLQYLKNTVIKETNKKLISDNKTILTFGKFLRWIGLWFLMATVSGYSW